MSWEADSKAEAGATADLHHAARMVTECEDALGKLSEAQRAVDEARRSAVCFRDGHVRTQSPHDHRYGLNRKTIDVLRDEVHTLMGQRDAAQRNLNETRLEGKKRSAAENVALQDNVRLRKRAEKARDNTRQQLDAMSASRDSRVWEVHRLRERVKEAERRMGAMAANWELCHIPLAHSHSFPSEDLQKGESTIISNVSAHDDATLKIIRDLQLLDKCILHWAKRAAGDVAETRKNDIANCALCAEYSSSRCRGCPISTRTGSRGCESFTSYRAWRALYWTGPGRPVTPASCDCAAKVALALCEMRAELAAELEAHDGK